MQFRHANIISVLAAVIAITQFAPCEKAKENAGKALDASRSDSTCQGGSVVTGSAGPNGA
jgi:hypothetical protein